MGLYLIAATPWYLDPSVWFGIFMAVGGLGFVIFVHEMGHFLAAKACGVKCDKFYVGFDIPMPKIFGFQIPSTFGKFQWGETEYGIGILPLGGYVKMLGQDDDPRKAAGEAERIKLRKTESGAEPNTVVEKIELDPRSFPAKKVWQRMIIISAGVIVNVIFAVIFAAVAYSIGVPIQPTVIGNTVPGSPAWVAGIEPGDRILRTTKDGRVKEHMRFDWDLRQDVVMNGGEHDMEMLIRRRDGKEETVSVRPRRLIPSELGSTSIGIVSLPILTLSTDERFTIEHFSAGKAPFQAGDQIVAINGEPVSHFTDYNRALWQHLAEPVTMTVERKQSGTPTQKAEIARVEIPVEPHRRKTLGLVMQHGPIIAIRPKSPAEKAGVKVGDKLESIADQPVGDVLTLASRLRKLFGQEIELKVRRDGQSDLMALKITPEVPNVSDDSAALGSYFGVDSLGLAFSVERVVKDVAPESSAAKAGLQAGDKIVSLAWVVAPELQKKFEKKYGRNPYTDEVVALNDSYKHWARMDDLIQELPPDISVKLVYQRGEKESSVTLEPVDDVEFQHQRGLIFKPYNETHIAESFGEAVSLGLRQTKEDGLRVVRMLRKLFSGQVSVTDLSGPPTILYVAGNEAMRGFPRLLIFLTMLSANLAIINFLPIPALDGGHMMFLLYEGVFRRAVNERIQMTLTMVGVCCLLGFMVLIFGLDIFKFVKFFG